MCLHFSKYHPILLLSPPPPTVQHRVPGAPHHHGNESADTGGTILVDASSPLATPSGADTSLTLDRSQMHADFPINSRGNC